MLREIITPKMVLERFIGRRQQQPQNVQQAGIDLPPLKTGELSQKSQDTAVINSVLRLMHEEYMTSTNPSYMNMLEKRAVTFNLDTNPRLLRGVITEKARKIHETKSQNDPREASEIAEDLALYVCTANKALKLISHEMGFEQQTLVQHGFRTRNPKIPMSNRTNIMIFTETGGILLAGIPSNTPKRERDIYYAPMSPEQTKTSGKLVRRSFSQDINLSQTPQLSPEPKDFELPRVFSMFVNKNPNLNLKRSFERIRKTLEETYWKTAGAPFRLNIGWEQTPVNVQAGEKITMTPAGGKYIYEVESLKNPQVKRYDGEKEAPMTAEEQRDANESFTRIRNLFCRTFCRGREFDWLGGIPIEEWEHKLDVNLDKVLEETMGKSPLKPGEKEYILDKYWGMGILHFLNSDSTEKEIFQDIKGKDAEEKRVQAREQMLAKIYAQTLKDFGLQQNIITNEFVKEAVEQIKLYE